MAKKSKQTNGIDPEKAGAFISRVENLVEDLASERGKYMAACKALREDIKEVYAEAKADGIPTKALKMVVRRRDLERKTEALAEFLDIDERSAYEQLVEDLGGLVELPLGQAAMDAQRREDGKAFDAAEKKNGKAKKGPSAEEAAALAEVEEKGIVGAAGAAMPQEPAPIAP